MCSMVSGVLVSASVRVHEDDASGAVSVQHEPRSGLRVDSSRDSADVDQLAHVRPLETVDEENGETEKKQALRESAYCGSGLYRAIRVSSPATLRKVWFRHVIESATTSENG